MLSTCTISCNLTRSFHNLMKKSYKLYPIIQSHTISYKCVQSHTHLIQTLSNHTTSYNVIQSHINLIQSHKNLIQTLYDYTISYDLKQIHINFILIQSPTIAYKSYAVPYKSHTHFVQL